MDHATQQELNKLISRRQDPRRGVGPMLGNARWAIGGAVMVGYILIPLTPFKAYMGLLTLGMFFGFLICWLIPIEIRRATKKRAERHGNFLCPWCRYALSSLPDEGVCPECGARYKRSVCEMLYQNAYRAYQPHAEELQRREVEAWTEAIELRDQFLSIESREH